MVQPHVGIHNVISGGSLAFRTHAHRAHAAHGDLMAIPVTYDEAECFANGGFFDLAGHAPTEITVDARVAPYFTYRTAGLMRTAYGMPLNAIPWQDYVVDGTTCPVRNPSRGRMATQALIDYHSAPVAVGVNCTASGPWVQSAYFGSSLAPQRTSSVVAAIGPA
jgi:hypothetical protein